MKELLNEILRSSKRFEFEEGGNGPTILKLTGYYTGKTIKLDLANLTEEMLEELIVEEEGEDYEF